MFLPFSTASGFLPPIRREYSAYPGLYLPHLVKVLDLSEMSKESHWQERHSSNSMLGTKKKNRMVTGKKSEQITKFLTSLFRYILIILHVSGYMGCLPHRDWQTFHTNLGNENFTVKYHCMSTLWVNRSVQMCSLSQRKWEHWNSATEKYRP